MSETAALLADDVRPAEGKRRPRPERGRGSLNALTARDAWRRVEGRWGERRLKFEHEIAESGHSQASRVGSAR
jgi:hypothetical protein